MKITQTQQAVFDVLGSAGENNYSYSDETISQLTGVTLNRVKGALEFWFDRGFLNRTASPAKKYQRNDTLNKSFEVEAVYGNSSIKHAHSFSEFLAMRA